MAATQLLAVKIMETAVLVLCAGALTAILSIRFDKQCVRWLLMLGVGVMVCGGLMLFAGSLLKIWL